MNKKKIILIGAGTVLLFSAGFLYVSMNQQEKSGLPRDTSAISIQESSEDDTTSSDSTIGSSVSEDTSDSVQSIYDQYQVTQGNPIDAIPELVSPATVGLIAANILNVPESSETVQSIPLNTTQPNEDTGEIVGPEMPTENNSGEEGTDIKIPDTGEGVGEITPPSDNSNENNGGSGGILTPPPIDYQPIIEAVVTQANRATEAAHQINDKVQAIKAELQNLQLIEENSEKSFSQLKNQQAEISTLILSYNRLSDDIKQYLQEDGSVHELDLSEYQALYDELGQKVSDIQSQQAQMISTNETLETQLDGATDTFLSLDETESVFDNLKTDQYINQETITSVNETVASTPEIVESVQSEVSAMNKADSDTDNAIQTTEEMMSAVQENKEAVGDQLASAVTNQESMGNILSSVDKNVQQVLDDFSLLPQLPMKEETENISTIDDELKLVDVSSLIEGS